jgi:glycerate 2-kinase
MERDLKRDASEIFNAGLKAADPYQAIRRSVNIDEQGILTVDDRTYDLNRYDRIFVIGAGKASSPMAEALEDLLGSRITEGTITTKYGHGLPLRTITITEAGHPVPDENGYAGTEHILRLLERSDEQTLIFCLISGGGSALMPLPVSGLTLDDKQKTTQALLVCGATIHEINTIRKHISAVKGGRLAKAAYPGTLISLILSDVIGDDLDVIASGPTVPDMSTYADCMEIINKYDFVDKIPSDVIAYIKRGDSGKESETPKPGDPVFNKTQAAIIGSSSLSINAAKGKADILGYNTLILSSFIEGETKDVARVHTAIIKEILKSGNPVNKPACIISGGETTVTIHGSGLGGRNMEFALAAALEIDGLDGVLVLSGGTDGTDGPTDAAGAYANGSTVKRSLEQGLSALEYLRNNDSYHFFKALGDLVMTGPTMTNVMDLRILLVV